MSLNWLVDWQMRRCQVTKFITVGYGDAPDCERARADLEDPDQMQGVWLIDRGSGVGFNPPIEVFALIEASNAGEAVELVAESE